MSPDPVPAPDAAPAADAPSTPRSHHDGWTAAWSVARDVPGWLTPAQGRVLFDAAAALAPGDVVVEIGSHRGRSTSLIARGAAAAGARVVAVDPFLAGGMFGGAATADHFAATLRAAGVQDVVTHERVRSTALRPRWHTPLAMVFVDGKHDYWTTADDLRWSAFLPEGGPILVHDCFSSIGVTLAVLARVLPSRRLRFVTRTGSLARFEVTGRGGVGAADRVRLLAQLPWWVRNVAVKIVLRAWRLVGTPPADPY